MKYLRKSRFDRDYAELSVEETLKRHEAILDRLAADRGYPIARTYYEVVSGESIAARPEIQKMLEEVSQGLYAGVLVVDLERLARGNGADQAYISQIFQFSGTKIVTPLKVYDPSNEFDEEYFEFGLYMSRREYKTINRRLIRGRDSSASEGKYINAIAPYGYKKVKLPNEKGFTLEPDPEEAPAVKKIFELYLNHAGTKLIANELNDRKIPTRHGALWTSSTISNIITNPIYMGKIRRGWSKQIKSLENGVVKKRVKRSTNMEEYHIYPGLHPALIDEDVFYDVQAIREKKRPSPKVRDGFQMQNAFSGLIFCQICGKRVGRTLSSRGTPRFRCVNARNCHNGSCNYAIVETKVIEGLRVWLAGYKVKIKSVGFSEDIADCREQIGRLEEEIAKLGAQMENAYDLVERGVYTLELFQSRREKLSGDMVALRAEIGRRAETLAILEASEKSQANLIPQTETLLESYDGMTMPERNTLFKEILYKIEYRKEASGEVVIDLYPRLPKI